MISEDSDEEFLCTHPELRTTANDVINNLLPLKSKALYDATYQSFKNWKVKHKAKQSSENVLLSYFDELSKKYKSSTLWAQYSMLKKELNNHETLDIGNFMKLNSFMKKQSVDYYQPRKSEVFHANEVQKFLNEAPDEQYLATKVVLILGVSGALRTEELINITINDIENRGGLLLVKILKTRTHIPRSFTIPEEFNEIVEKYRKLRPANVTNDRFLLNFQNGKCTTQVIGKNKIGSMPKQIATFLQLPDVDCFTGHCFRRTSANLLAESVVNSTDHQQNDDWKSITVATGYVQDTVHRKLKRGSLISSTINVPSTCSNQNLSSEVPLKKAKTDVDPKKEAE